MEDNLKQVDSDLYKKSLLELLNLPYEVLEVVYQYVALDKAEEVRQIYKLLEAASNSIIGPSYPKVRTLISLMIKGCKVKISHPLFSLFNQKLNGYPFQENIEAFHLLYMPMWFIQTCLGKDYRPHSQFLVYGALIDDIFRLTWWVKSQLEENNKTEAKLSVLYRLLNLAKHYYKLSCTVNQGTFLTFYFKDKNMFLLSDLLTSSFKIDNERVGKRKASTIAEFKAGVTKKMKLDKSLSHHSYVLSTPRQNTSFPKCPIVERCGEVSSVKKGTIESPLQILDLPEHVLESIFNLFYPGELSHLRGVCKKFDILASEQLNKAFHSLRTLVRNRVSEEGESQQTMEQSAADPSIMQPFHTLVLVSLSLECFHVILGPYIKDKTCCFFAGKILEKGHKLIFEATYGQSSENLAKRKSYLDASVFALECFEKSIKTNNLEKSKSDRVDTMKPPHHADDLEK